MLNGSTLNGVTLNQGDARGASLEAVFSIAFGVAADAHPQQRLTADAVTIVYGVEGYPRIRINTGDVDPVDFALSAEGTIYTPKFLAALPVDVELAAESDADALRGLPIMAGRVNPVSVDFSYQVDGGVRFTPDLASRKTPASVCLAMSADAELRHYSRGLDIDAQNFWRLP